MEVLPRSVIGRAEAAAQLGGACGLCVDDPAVLFPRSDGLRRIVDLMMAAPADRATLDAWAKRAGMSERTLARLISRETGMSFRRWRQQLSVVLAVKWLAGGASIQQVAADLGYESVPSFVTMFRRALGTSPGRYMAERHSGRS
jgi:AraC-like DNA-binding protein